MPKTLTGSGNTWLGTVTAPANGDKRSAQSVQVGFQDCAENTSFLYHCRLKRVYRSTVSNVGISQEIDVIAIPIAAEAGDVLVCHADCLATMSTPDALHLDVRPGTMLAYWEFGASTAKQSVSFSGVTTVVADTTTVVLCVSGAGTVNIASLVIEVFGKNTIIN